MSTSQSIKRTWALFCISTIIVNTTGACLSCARPLTAPLPVQSLCCDLTSWPTESESETELLYLFVVRWKVTVWTCIHMRFAWNSTCTFQQQYIVMLICNTIQCLAHGSNRVNSNHVTSHPVPWFSSCCGLSCVWLSGQHQTVSLA